jgi:hypothetical protein
MLICMLLGILTRVSAMVCPDIACSAVSLAMSLTQSFTYPIPRTSWRRSVRTCSATLEWRFGYFEW